jgi:hypothetical protein
MLPEPEYGCAICDIEGVGRSRATGEKGTEFSEGADDEGPRVSSPREWS